MMASRVRARDWSATALGPIEGWPATLKAAAMLMLETGFPAALVWGSARVMLFNDGLAALLGERAGLLGAPCSAILGSAWDALGPPVERAMAGETVLVDAVPLVVDRDGEAGQARFSLSCAPVRAPAGAVLGCIGTLVETGGAARMRDDPAGAPPRHHAAEQQQRVLIEGVPQILWRAVDGGRWTWASPQWSHYTGQPEAGSHDRGWLDPVHPDDRAAAMAAWTGAVEQGGFQADYRLLHRAEGRYRWFQARATPVRDPNGRIVEWLGTSIDVDDLRGLHGRQQRLLAELQHRVRNILTVIRSVFNRTVEASTSIEDIVDHFQGRLDALARTQVVVAWNAGGLVDLENLIRDELLSVGVTDGPAMRIEGPEVAMPAKMAGSVGLAIHELTTNALKYGALKIATGRLNIRWALNIGHGGGRRLDLTWKEQGIPAISLVPSRKGFGSELIEDALPYRLGAETRLDFRAGGLCCTISLPLPDQGASTVDPWEIW